jgi:hypothetical protein
MDKLIPRPGDPFACWFGRGDDASRRLMSGKKHSSRGGKATMRLWPNEETFVKLLMRLAQPRVSHGVV